MNSDQELALRNALGTNIQMALPQTVQPVVKTQRQVSATQYDPEKLAALKSALTAPRMKMGKWESLANALAQTPEARSFTGGFGEEIINPWAVGLSSLARGFGSTYGALKANEREVAEQAREDAIKAAQLEAEATKQAITDQEALDWMKVNDPSAQAQKQLEQEQQKAQQKEAALDALHTLKNIGDKGYWSGGIGGWNNESDSRWNSQTTAEVLGKREQALSALLPLTNSIARASGGSGINTVGEMMAYLGVPENATSAQLKGAIPGLVKKLGLESEFYQQSPISGGMAF